jgi:hypothetical protein
MNQLAPVTPQQIVEEFSAKITPKVIDSINELIRAQWDGNQAYIDTTALKILMSCPKPGYSQALLEIEKIYRNAGWYVKHESSQRDGDYYIFRMGGSASLQDR